MRRELEILVKTRESMIPKGNCALRNGARILADSWLSAMVGVGQVALSVE
jgi:hypothetical protein